MAPTANFDTSQFARSSQGRDDRKVKVVISGMSGTYPNTESVKGLVDILYNKVNPISDAKGRWQNNYPGLPQYTGMIPGIEKFDAQFFKVHYRLANNMDPMSRMMLEHAYQAIFDAGLSPQQLYGSKVGVYVGSCFSESEKTCFYVANNRTGFGIAGCSKSMFANRISYWLNAKGPSMSIDAACASSIVALEKAYEAIASGVCEAAIVGGCNLCLYPQSSIHYGRIMTLCLDGKTKTFDKNADGCCRSEAVNVLFLQKAENANRIYAQVCHAKTVFCPSEKSMYQNYGPNRNPDELAEFINTFYDEAKISPKAVEYVEAFGSAQADADKTELQAIEKVYCDNRQGTLFVGSVMSNIGYTEAASGISAITKLCLGYHTGKIASNLHCENPRDDIAALQDGRMRVVTDHQPFNRTYTAVSNLAVTGLNGHVLLHGLYKPKDLSRYETSLPYLVPLSSRQESGVKVIIDELKSHPLDAEQIALLHNIHEYNVPGHLGRGYAILGKDAENNTKVLSEKNDYFDDAKRPLWFVYSGMGSQWAGMGTELMRIPIFAAAIERCRIALEPKRIDIVQIINSPDKTTFDNILHSFVGIAAVQIGLTDVLKEIGLVPDMIIGHSVGELGCAYADGCMTAEEMILSAYSRGLVSLQTKLIRGSMAAVGLGYQQIAPMCPDDIEVACHNGPDSATISGPADSMKEFVASLTAKGIFAKEVPCSNIAYHSRYIKDAAPGLLKYLKQVLKTPKKRSERWLSTSVPEENWSLEEAQYSSAEYHTNNLLRSVLFEETSRLIPANAVLIEVAPHGLLQAILKRSLPESCINIPLTRRGHSDNVVMFLDAIGKLYMTGYNPKVNAIYPKVEFPVSTGTPMLSHLMEWAHHENWKVVRYFSATRAVAPIATFVISTCDDEHKFLEGHVINGENRFPYAKAIECVWDTLAMSTGHKKKEISVKFSDIYLKEQPIIYKDEPLRLHCSINVGNGYFEVNHENFTLISGFVKVTKATKVKNAYKKKSHEDIMEGLQLTRDDIYKVFHERGFEYSNEFRSLLSADIKGSRGQVIWKNNWVTILDGMIQLHALKRNYCGVSKASYIRQIYIDLNHHSQVLESSSNILPIDYFSVEHFARCGGILMFEVKFNDIPLSITEKISLKSSDLIPYNQIKTEKDQSREEVPTQCKEKLISEIPMTLRSKTAGDLHSLQWVEDVNKYNNVPLIEVHYVGLNIRDAKRASGEIPWRYEGETEIGYGMEFSGVTESGERVMGLMTGGAASTHIPTDSALLWPVPQWWTLEDAATVPLAYAQAIYCLFIRTQLRKGMKILVYDGASPFGQALISIALAHECTVYAKVNEMRQKHFLRKRFPLLSGKNIGCSTVVEFRDMILMETKSEQNDLAACDLVIASAKNYVREILLECVGACGTYLDTSLPDFNHMSNLRMNYLRNDKSYIPVVFSRLFTNNNIKELKQIQQLIHKGISAGYVNPLTRVKLAAQQAPRAAKIVLSGRLHGQLLLQIHSDLPIITTGLELSAHSGHVIVTNVIDTFALRFAEMLIVRGAQNLVIFGDKEDKFDWYMMSKLKTWKHIGVNVILFDEKVTINSNLGDQLKDYMDLRTVEGVYMLGDKKSGALKEKLETILVKLDDTVRKQCPSIKYFTVISEDLEFGRNICLQRNKDKLPAKLILLGEINKFEYMTPISDGMSPLSALHAVERAMTSSGTIINVYFEKTQMDWIDWKLTNILGTKISGIKSEKLKVKKFIDSSKCQELEEYLKDKIKINIEDASELTIERLRNLLENIKKMERSKESGLNLFFSHVDPDEMTATSEIILMPTLVDNSNKRDDEFDPDQPYLTIIPGLDGHYKRFRQLCERLKVSAVVLQPGLDYPHETIPDIAQRLVKNMIKMIHLKENFYLLGYSFGALVALEMAAILERQGYTGVVYCVDSSPDTFSKTLQKLVPSSSTQLQDSIILHMYNLMTNANDFNFISRLKSINSWGEKLDFCMRKLSGKIPHSTQYARAVIEAAYGRIERAHKYNATAVKARPLKSQIVVLNATEPQNPDLGLSKYTLTQPAICQLEAGHASVLQHLGCANMINTYLRKDILERFEAMNTCETYLTNADSFMQDS